MNSSSRLVKYIENPELDSISTFLTDRPLGCVILNGKLEMFQIENKSAGNGNGTGMGAVKEEILPSEKMSGIKYPKPHVKISAYPKPMGRSKSDGLEDLPSAPLTSSNLRMKNKENLLSSGLTTATTTPATSLATSPVLSSIALPPPHPNTSKAAAGVARQISDPQEWTIVSRRPRSNSAQFSTDSNPSSRVVVGPNGKSKIIVGSNASFVNQQSSSRNNKKRSSSLSDLSETSAKQVLADVAAVLNESFPDYDFSNIRAKQVVERDVVGAMQVVNAYLSDLVSPNGSGNLLEKLWKQLDDAINLRRCDIYSYITDNEGDPFSAGAIWSFNYFFFNRDMKRICFMSCVATRSVALLR
jgi:hypothetical protein